MNCFCSKRYTILTTTQYCTLTPIISFVRHYYPTTNDKHNVPFLMMILLSINSQKRILGGFHKSKEIFCMLRFLTMREQEKSEQCKMY